MIKMYNAEVLSKFPVVQHFTFGSLFQWERDPSASPAKLSVHTSNQPSQQRAGSSSTSQPQESGRLEGTKAPWASSGGATPASNTRFPTQQPLRSNVDEPSTRAPWATQSSNDQPLPLSGTVAPWARKATEQQQANPRDPTRKPWADK